MATLTAFLEEKMNRAVQNQQLAQAPSSSALTKRAVFQQDGNVMGSQSVTMVVMRQTVEIIPVQAMISLVPVERLALTRSGFVIKMMIVETCQMKLIALQVNHVKTISFHVKMDCVLTRPGFVTDKMTVETGLMSLTAHKQSAMQPLSSDVLMALALTSTGNAMGMLTVLTRVTKRAVVQ